MRNMRELGNAFGKADNGFVDNVYHTLADMQRKQFSKPVINKNLRFIAATVIICILLTGAALAAANAWGVLDFLHKRENGSTVLPQASEIIQTNVPQVPVDTDIADFSVREAAFDGHDFYLIVDVKPTSGKYLLLGPDVYPQDPMGNMGPLFSGKTETIADYAEANGQEMIQTTVGVDGVNGQGADYLLQQDGTLTYMISGSLLDDSDKAELKLHCILTKFKSQDGKDIRENIKRCILSFTLENTGIRAIVSSFAAAEYADCGVRIDSMMLKASELAVYAEIRYTVIDTAKFEAADTGLEFEFLDADGNSLPPGAAGGGGITTEDGVHYVQESSLSAMETLPREIAVRGFNIWDKNKYETHTFEMK